MRMLNTTSPIVVALKRMRKELDADPDYKRSWIDNLSMFLYDNLDDDRLKDKTFRDHVAEQLLKFVF